MTTPSPSKKETLSNRIAAQYAEIILSPGFQKIADQAVNQAEEDHELYSVWRENADLHLGMVASAVVMGQDLSSSFWDQQREIAIGILNGQPTGPFADYFYKLKLNGRAAEVDPSDGDISHLPPGEYDIINSNSTISRISREIESPLEFIEEGIGYMRSRRQKGGSKFEGPENYATMLKYFTDKTFDQPIDPKDKQKLRKFVGECTGQFLRVAGRDAPNIVEVTNVLSAVKNLPKGTFDAKLSSGILRYSLMTLDEFTSEGVNLLQGAIAHMDLSECAEPAAMTVDLALRKGAKFERSGDFLTSLRAVRNLPHTTASERAFTTLLDVRNELEIAADLEKLAEMNRHLLAIVSETTENIHDTKRAKEVAEYIARRAIQIYKNTETHTSSQEELEKTHKTVSRILSDAKKI